MPVAAPGDFAMVAEIKPKPTLDSETVMNLKEGSAESLRNLPQKRTKQSHNAEKQVVVQSRKPNSQTRKLRLDVAWQKQQRYNHCYDGYSKKKNQAFSLQSHK
jgi:hypothetical protein